MLSRILRCVVTFVVLMTVTVAGLPIVICVSQSHGTAVEFDQPYSDHQNNPGSHFILFGGARNILQSTDCTDFRLDRGTLVKESCEGKPKTYLSLRDNTIVFATTVDFPVMAPRHAAHQKQSRTFGSTFRSSISDLGTVILLI